MHQEAFGSPEFVLFGIVLLPNLPKGTGLFSSKFLLNEKLFVFL